MTEPSAFERAVARVADGRDAQEEAAALVAAMTPEERRGCLDGDQPCWAGLAAMVHGDYHRRPFLAARVERLGFPGFAFSDGPRGCVIGPATAFPVSMARGATWDPALEERIGDAIGREIRAVGATLYGGVCVNLLRHPAWGRAQETYGEDPFLVGEMGAALVRGVQRHAMACVKHFAANSMENARFTVDVTVDEVALHETYLPHFRRIVDEGVACVMSAYNAVNGEWCGQNHALLTDVLRSEWGFAGMVISDWIFGLRDATRSVRAGLDVEMPFPMVRARDLGAAVTDGTVDEDEISALAARVVTTVLRWWPVLSRPAPGVDVLASPAHRRLARDAAAASIVLLRNEDVDGRAGLPLDEHSLSRLAVIGRLAAVRNLGDGGSSDVWAPEVVNALDGLRAALAPRVEVAYDDGADPTRAAALAASCDAAVVVVGYTKADEGEFIGAIDAPELVALFPGPDDPARVREFEAPIEDLRARWPNPDPDASGGFATGGDRSSLRLHDADEVVIRVVGSACPRTVVAVVAGSAVVVDGWYKAVPAIMMIWYAGMEGGHALADVVLGRAEPAGRLPFSVPTDPDHLPLFERDATNVIYDEWVGYRHLAREGRPARYPFGFGLSYTRLAITDAAVTVDVGRRDLVVRARVENQGERPGVELVQVYAGTPDRSPRLVGFARVPLGAGESQDVEIRILRRDLARRDPVTHTWVDVAGPVEVTVGRYAGDAAAIVIPANW